MDVVDFMEETATATLKVAAESYDSAYERVNKLATLIAGGAGVAGVHALGKIGASPGSRICRGIAKCAKPQQWAHLRA